MTDPIPFQRSRTMSGGLKQQWGVGEPKRPGLDEQTQALKAAFESSMNAMNEHLRFTAVHGRRARHDPLASRREALVPRYQSALTEVDPADANKAKGSIDKLLADAEALGAEVASFRGEAEKAFNEWQSREAAFDAAVVQLEELQARQHPKEGEVRGLIDGIRDHVKDRAYARATAALDEFLNASARARDFVATLAKPSKISSQVHAHVAAVEELELEAAQQPSPFAKARAEWLAPSLQPAEAPDGGQVAAARRLVQSTVILFNRTGSDLRLLRSELKFNTARFVPAPPALIPARGQATFLENGRTACTMAARIPTLPR